MLDYCTCLHLCIMPYEVSYGLVIFFIIQLVWGVYKSGSIRSFAKLFYCLCKEYLNMYCRVLQHIALTWWDSYWFCIVWQSWESWDIVFTPESWRPMKLELHGHFPSQMFPCHFFCSCVCRRHPVIYKLTNTCIT